MIHKSSIQIESQLMKLLQHALSQKGVFQCRTTPASLAINLECNEFLRHLGRVCSNCGRTSAINRAKMAIFEITWGKIWQKLIKIHTRWAFSEQGDTQLSSSLLRHRTPFWSLLSIWLCSFADRKLWHQHARSRKRDYIFRSAIIDRTAHRVEVSLISNRRVSDSDALRLTFFKTLKAPAYNALSGRRATKHCLCVCQTVHVYFSEGLAFSKTPSLRSDCESLSAALVFVGKVAAAPSICRYNT
jgi:hypothetical protein